jgi:hypothetical protein
MIEYVFANQIPGDVPIYSDTQAAISGLGNIGIAPHQDGVIRVVQAVQYKTLQGWHIRIDQVPGHSRIVRNPIADQLPGQPASER